VNEPTGLRPEQLAVLEHIATLAVERGRLMASILADVTSGRRSPYDAEVQIAMLDFCSLGRFIGSLPPPVYQAIVTAEMDHSFAEHGSLWEAATRLTQQVALATGTEASEVDRN
jgi:hypothetical protein